jgi:hypothetical protein
VTTFEKNGSEFINNNILSSDSCSLRQEDCSNLIFENPFWPHDLLIKLTGKIKTTLKVRPPKIHSCKVL